MYLKNGTFLQGERYKIVRHINSGGFGNTYEGIHVMLDKRVAIKEFFVKDFCNRDETTSQVTTGITAKTALVSKLRKKFIDEARSLCKLEHPNIVHVYDVFEENGTAYYVMDYIDGKSVHEILKTQNCLPESQAVKYIGQVAHALQYVHEKNRLHLDIKPGNIMIDANDNAVLIDFGASKQYEEESGENTSTLLGKTPGYAPIEQMGNSVQTFTPATDIYALGATLYKMLSGITPPESTILVSDDDALKPLPSFITPSTREAVECAMKVKRNERPQSIEEWLKILGNIPSENMEEGKNPKEGESPLVKNEEETVVENPSNDDSGSTPFAKNEASENPYAKALAKYKLWQEQGLRLVCFPYMVNIAWFTELYYSKPYLIRNNDKPIKYGWPYMCFTLLFGIWRLLGIFHAIRSIRNAFVGCEVEVTQEIIEDIDIRGNKDGMTKLGGVLAVLFMIAIPSLVISQCRSANHDKDIVITDTLQYCTDMEKQFLKKYPRAMYNGKGEDSLKITDSRIVFDCPKNYICQTIADSVTNTIYYELQRKDNYGWGVINSGFDFYLDHVTEDDVDLFGKNTMENILKLYDNVDSPRYATISSKRYKKNGNFIIERNYAVEFNGINFDSHQEEAVWRFAFIVNLNVNKWAQICIQGLKDVEYSVFLNCCNLE